MPAPSPSAPMGLPAATTTLPALLALLPNGVVYYLPIYDATGQVIDFRFAYLNAAAQRLLALPAQPTATYLEYWPGSATTGSFAFHRAAFLAGQPTEHKEPYLADGYRHLHACRLAEGLLVSLTNVEDWPPISVADILGRQPVQEATASQPHDTALRQAHEQGELLTRTLGQVPAAVATLRGPDHRFAFLNDQYLALTAGRAVVGRTVAEALPEVVGQGFIDLLDEVYTTGRPYLGAETPIQLQEAGQDQPGLRYLNFTYQPLLEDQGRVGGILVFAVEVTAQVEARQQVQNLNEELAAINEELRASNEEYLVTNTALADSQLQLGLLNQELDAFNQDLEVRVAARTQEAQQQRGRLEQLVQTAPMAIGVFDGPEWVYQLANPRYQQLFPSRELLGQRLVDALPEVADQPLMDILHQVYDTGIPFESREVLVPRARTAYGPVEDTYVDLTYQARYDEQGHIDGLVTFAVDVTMQVLARRQIEAQERETNFLNEELQVANEEIRANNDELEARVQERTREVQQARQATEHQRALLQRVLEQAPVAIAIMEEPSHRITFANARMAAIWGRPVAQVLGQPHFEALPDTRGQGLETIFTGVFETGQPVTLAEQLTYLDRTSTGERTPHYLHMVFEPLRDEQGHITGIIAAATDVTEMVLTHQQVEAQQRQTTQLNEELRVANEAIRANNAELVYTQAQLRELNEDLEARVTARTRETQAALVDVQRQQERLHTLFEEAPVAIAVFRGPQYVIELANPAICAIWGRMPQQALHRPLFELLPEAAGQGFEQLLDEVMATGIPFVAHELPSVINRHGRRDTVYWNFVYQPLREGLTSITAVTVVAVEVTDQVLARQQVQELNEALQGANQGLTTTNLLLTRTNADLDNFIYTASHDLKAPISNIEGLLRLLEDLLPAEQLRTDEMLLSVLARMQGAVERFTRTIGHLTDVSKLQLEFAQPAVPTPLAPLLAGIRQDLAPLLTETGGQLQVDVAECPTLLISEKNLRSLLYNLLSNALKYHHPNRPPVVRVSCHFEGERRVLRVQDNGLGLSSGQQAKLFQLFGRLHTHVEGTGVGLYMAKKMVENANGTLTVESREGEGTTFTASFPA